MNFSGSSRNSDSTYFNEKLESAKKGLENYPNIKEISNNFKDATRENHTENFMLNLLAYVQSTNSSDIEIHAKKLTQIDSLVSKLLKDLPKDNRNKLVARLNSFKEENYHLMYELEFYIELEDNSKISEIHYENNNQGNHDFNLKVESEELNIELTSLGKSLIQKEIEEGFKLATKEILNSFPDNIYLQLTLDSDRLLNGERAIAQKIKERVLKAYELVKNIILVDLNGLCRIENFQSRDKSLYELRDYYDYYHEFGKRLTKLLSNEEGLLFLKRTKADDLIKSPLISFIIGPARWGSINVSTQCLQPSKAEDLRKKSLVEQLKRLIVEKIHKKQLKDKKNPLIAIRFDDFAFMHYGSDSDYWGKESLEELRKIIQECFLETKENEILGVLIFENTVKKSRFIKNPNVLISNEILNKINLLKE